MAAVGEVPDPASARLAPGPAPRTTAGWRLLAAGLLGAGLTAAVLWFMLRPGESPAGATSPPVGSAGIQIKFVSAPAGATVRITDRIAGEITEPGGIPGADQPLGVTPFVQRFPRSDRRLTIAFVKPGFVTVTQDIALASDDAVAVELVPASPALSPQAAAPPVQPTASPATASPATAPPATAPPATAPPATAPPAAAPPATAPSAAAPPAAAPPPDPARKRPPVKRPPERPLDRNGTLDVFESP